MLRMKVLKRFIDDNKQRFEVIVLPQTLNRTRITTGT